MGSHCTEITNKLQASHTELFNHHTLFDGQNILFMTRRIDGEKNSKVRLHSSQASRAESSLLCNPSQTAKDILQTLYCILIIPMAVILLLSACSS
jgi:hypothetical protein